MMIPLTAKQRPATILLHHCQPRPASRAVTTGAKTMVPKPEPQVDIPVTKDLFFSNQYPTAVTAGTYIRPRLRPPSTPYDIISRYTLGENIDRKMETAVTIAPAINYNVSLGPNVLTKEEEIDPINMIAPARILPT